MNVYVHSLWHCKKHVLSLYSFGLKNLKRIAFEDCIFATVICHSTASVIRRNVTSHLENGSDRQTKEEKELNTNCNIIYTKKV